MHLNIGRDPVQRHVEKQVCAAYVHVLHILVYIYMCMHVYNIYTYIYMYIYIYRKRPYAKARWKASSCCMSRKRPKAWFTSTSLSKHRVPTSRNASTCRHLVPARRVEPASHHVRERARERERARGFQEFINVSCSRFVRVGGWEGGSKTASYYRVAKTHILPWVTGHFSQKGPGLKSLRLPRARLQVYFAKEPQLKKKSRWFLSQ